MFHGAVITMVYYTTTHYRNIADICERASRGTTHRKYLDEEIFLNNELVIPDVATQIKILEQLNCKQILHQEIANCLTHQQTLLKKLRQQILQEAIEGKLSADWRRQNPKTEPASELLKRIQTEKAQLIKNKKLKPQKTLPPIKPEETPFALPDAWEWCRLGDIVLMQYGVGLKKSQTKIAGEYAVYGSNGVIGYHDKGLTDKQAIVIGRKGSAGAIQVSHIGSWTTDVAFYIEEPTTTNFRHLIFLLESLNLSDLGKGVKPGLNRNDAYLLKLPLPPLAEQKAIVAKVEKLLTLCDQLESKIKQSQHHANSLMQAVLQEAFAGASI